jgi:hypothetical protein
LLTGVDFSAEQVEALNIITQCVCKADLDNVLEPLLAIVANLEVRDIVMYKEIVATSIKDEDAGAELELERAKEEKTQTIITTYLSIAGRP